MENNVNLQETLSKKNAELEQVKAQINQIDQQVAQLQKSRDGLLTKGIELQGAVRVLQEMIAVPEPVKA